jgi:tetratricopeptide (TPR) repeat protein
VGEAYESLYLHQLAIPHLEKAVVLRRTSLGADHPETLSTMVLLAQVLGVMGQTHDAVILLEDVLEKYQRLFGPAHPTTLDAMSRLTHACRQAGMWNRAIVLAKQVLEKRTATLGPTHRETVGAMHTLAMCYGEAGFFEESIAWHEKTLKATDDTNIHARSTYARALQGAGNLEEADRVLRKTLELVSELRDRRARDNGIALVDIILGLNLLLQGRYVEAEPVAREALAYFEKELPDDCNHFHALSMVGGARSWANASTPRRSLSWCKGTRACSNARPSSMPVSSPG